MMRKITFVFFLTIYNNSLSAQEIITKAKLSYLKFMDMNLETKNLKDQKIRKIEFTFNSNVLKVNNSLFPNQQMQFLQKANENDGYLYVDNGTKKVKVEEPASKIFDIGAFDIDATIEYEYLKDTLTIGGIFCNKATIKYYVDGNSKTMTMWYDKTRKLQLDGYRYFFKALNGMPVKFSFIEKPTISFPGLESLVINSQITLELFDDTIDDTLVNIDNEKEYTLINKNEIMNYLNFGGRIRKPNSNNEPQGEAISKTITNSNGMETTVTKYNPFKLNTPLQPFSGKSLSGEIVNSELLQNKVLVINFWFTQCKPCIKEIPILNEVKNKFADNKLVNFYSITYDKKEDVAALFKNVSYNFTAIVDAQDIVEKYNIFTYPATIIVDQKGIIKFIQIGEFSSAKQFTTELEKVLLNTEK